MVKCPAPLHLCFFILHCLCFSQHRRWCPAALWYRSARHDSMGDSSGRKARNFKNNRNTRSIGWNSHIAASWCRTPFLVCCNNDGYCWVSLGVLQYHREKNHGCCCFYRGEFHPVNPGRIDYSSVLPFSSSYRYIWISSGRAFWCNYIGRCISAVVFIAPLTQVHNGQYYSTQRTLSGHSRWDHIFGRNAHRQNPSRKRHYFGWNWLSYFL